MDFWARRSLFKEIGSISCGRTIQTTRNRAVKISCRALKTYPHCPLVTCFVEQWSETDPWSCLPFVFKKTWVTQNVLFISLWQISVAWGSWSLECSAVSPWFCFCPPLRRIPLENRKSGALGAGSGLCQCLASVMLAGDSTSLDFGCLQWKALTKTTRTWSSWPGPPPTAKSAGSGHSLCGPRPALFSDSFYAHVASSLRPLYCLPMVLLAVTFVFPPPSKSSLEGPCVPLSRLLHRETLFRAGKYLMGEFRL